MHIPQNADVWISCTIHNRQHLAQNPETAPISRFCLEPSWSLAAAQELPMRKRFLSSLTVLLAGTHLALAQAPAANTPTSQPPAPYYRPAQDAGASPYCPNPLALV